VQSHCEHLDRNWKEAGGRRERERERERGRAKERRSDSDRLRTVGSSSASGLRGGGGEDDGFVEGCEADPRIPTEVKGQYGFPIRSGMLVPGTDNKGAPVRSFAISSWKGKRSEEIERERRRERKEE